MSAIEAGTHVWLAAGVTDLRRGFTGLSVIAAETLKEDPFAEHVFVFRGWRSDLS